MRALLNVALCLHLEILHCVQDEESWNRHPEWNEGSPAIGTEPMVGDPSLRSG
ncbi:hypothetical protein [Legionella quateirensis]|uniref:hypothetical protein n=1 Tax=Legionella quateirensis TaxID=45072 RepID=UPI001558C831|nr:hypothetical protein [Legionella quateirensis]